MAAKIEAASVTSMPPSNGSSRSWTPSSSREPAEPAVSGFEVEGDTVLWHISTTLPGMGEDGAYLAEETDLRAAFGTDDKIHEVWSVRSGMG